MYQQVSFAKFFPIALMVGVFAFLLLWIGGMYGVQAWVVFIAWAMWYAIGPTLSVRKKRFVKNLIGGLGGVVYAIVFLLLIPTFSQFAGSFAVPVLAFLAGVTIILLELTDWFEVATSYFFTFAGFFAYAFGKFGVGDYGILFSGKIGMIDGYVADGLWYTAYLLIGLAIGFMTDFLRFQILKGEGLPDESQQRTIFDRESPPTTSPPVMRP